MGTRSVMECSGQQLQADGDVTEGEVEVDKERPAPVEAR